MIAKEIIKRLERIVGTENVFTSEEDRICYAYDATQIQFLPDAIVRPVSADEVSGVLKIANEEGIPVVPRGAGSGFSGGAVPVKGGIILSIERMNRILEIDEEEMIAIVEPGVVNGALQREVERRWLFYPPDPSSMDFCTIGGNIGHGASGARAIKYGGTKDYVLGLEVVLPTGEIMKTGVKTPKSVAGYDLTRLLIGSEGTLGVVTKATLKLLPLPESVVTYLTLFKTIEEAVDIVVKIILSRIVPRALEFVDQETIRTVKDNLALPLSEETGALLIIELDGNPEAVKRDGLKIREICEKGRAIDVMTAETKEERERIWKARRSVSQSLYKISPAKINEDIVVPRKRLPEMVRELKRIGDKYSLRVVGFGHAGDGNIHVNIMTDRRNKEEYQRAQDAVKEVFEAVVRLEGTISGEHGIGLTKAPYLGIEKEEIEIEMMKRIKRAFDPKGILNPGKIFI